MKNAEDEAAPVPKFGLIALKRLNPSAIASMFIPCGRRNTFDTRRLNIDSAAPRPQFTVSHVPISLKDGTPASSTPVNSKAVG